MAIVHLPLGGQVHTDRLPTGRAVAVTHVASKGGVTLYKNARGRLYGTGRLGESNSYGGGRWPFIPDLLACMRILKIIDRAEERRQVAEYKRLQDAQAARWAVGEFLRGAERLGIELTPEQTKKIEKAQREAQEGGARRPSARRRREVSDDPHHKN